MRNWDRKMKVAALSIISNTMLIIFKVIAGILSGSVSIISEGIHSGMDLLASIISFFSVRMASKPADKEHPYGHGKIENVSGFVEGVLILVASVWIIYEAIHKIIKPTEIEKAYVAIGVMLISAVINIFVSKKLYKTAKEEDSVALEADALHLRTDVYTSFGVAIGIILLKITSINILDPIVAILVAILILKEAIGLCKRSFLPLTDVKLSDEDEKILNSILEKYNDRVLQFHNVRTRKSGKIKQIDFHMIVNKTLTVEEAHSLSEFIEEDVERVLKNTDVNIHIEPDTRMKMLNL